MPRIPNEMKEFIIEAVGAVVVVAVPFIVKVLKGKLTGQNGGITN